MMILLEKGEEICLQNAILLASKYWYFVKLKCILNDNPTVIDIHLKNEILRSSSLQCQQSNFRNVQKSPFWLIRDIEQPMIQSCTRMA